MPEKSQNICTPQPFFLIFSPKSRKKTLSSARVVPCPVTSIRTVGPPRLSRQSVAYVCACTVDLRLHTEMHPFPVRTAFKPFSVCRTYKHLTRTERAGLFVRHNGGGAGQIERWQPSHKRMLDCSKAMRQAMSRHLLF